MSYLEAELSGDLVHSNVLVLDDIMKEGRGNHFIFSPHIGTEVSHLQRVSDIWRPTLAPAASVLFHSRFKGVTEKTRVRRHVSSDLFDQFGIPLFRTFLFVFCYRRVHCVASIFKFCHLSHCNT